MLKKLESDRYAGIDEPSNSSEPLDKHVRYTASLRVYDNDNQSHSYVLDLAWIALNFTRSCVAIQFVDIS